LKIILDIAGWHFLRQMAAFGQIETCDPFQKAYASMQ